MDQVEKYRLEQLEKKFKIESDRLYENNRKLKKEIEEIKKSILLVKGAMWALGIITSCITWIMGYFK